MEITKKKLIAVLDRNFREAGVRVTVRRYNRILTDLGFELERGVMIYAGLDIDGVAKLFTIENNLPVLVRNADWVKLLDGMGAEMGELLLVSFRREPQPSPDSEEE